MKKIIALMLTVMMLLTSVSLTVAAEEVLTPVSLYAGARTITAEYDAEALTEANVGNIVLTTIEGTAVPFTTKINGEFLTIIADKEFTRDTQEYIIKLGNANKVFKIETLFKPNFVANVAENTVSDLYIEKGTGTAVDVVDKDTVILSTNSGNFVINNDDIANYENASLVADVYYLDGHVKGTRATFAYNVTNKSHAYAYTGDYASNTKRALWYLDGPNGRYYDRMVAISDGTKQAKDKLLAYYGFAVADQKPSITKIDSSEMVPALRENNYGTSIVSNTATIGTTQLPEGFDRSKNKYHYVIDKMGAVGTLMMNDTFIDIMDSKDYYDDYNAKNGTALEVSTKGYFVINPISTNAGRYKMMLSNVVLITSNMRDFATGNLTANFEAENNKIAITFAGAENIDLSDVAVEDYISFSENLPYKVLSKEGNKVVIEAVNPSYKTYTLTVAAGLGYDALTVKEPQTFDITFENPNAGALTPVKVYAGARTITAEYERAITEADLGTIELTTVEGTAVPFTTKINDEFLTIIADKEFTRDTQEYSLNIGNTAKIFKIKTIFKPEFAVKSSTEIEDLIIDAGNGVAADVVDKDTVILSTNQGSFTLDNDEIANYENASFVADIGFIGGNANRAKAIFAFNVSSDKSSFAYQYNDKPKVSRAFWYLDGENGAKFNRRVAVTDGKSLLAFPGYDSLIAPVADTSTIAVKPTVWTNSYGSTYTRNSTIIGTAILPPADTTISYDKGNISRVVIDKMGAVGTLMYNDSFVDIMDTQDYYDEYNTANGTSLNAATKGYFSINPCSNINTGNFRFFLTNIALITSEVKEYATGNLTASFEAENNKIAITFDGAENIDLSDVAVEEYISLTDDLAYNVLSKEGNKIVIELVNPEYKTYTITVAEGFGYDALTVKADQTFDITFEDPNANALVPVKLYAGARTITVEYAKAITEADLGIIELTTLEGAIVPYTTKINDEFLTIIADDEFVRDTQEYVIKLGNTKKIFKIKTLFKPQFEKLSETEVKDLHISGTNGSTVDVVDKDTLILSTLYDNFVLDYDDIANYENASLVADVYYDTPNTTGTHNVLAYNVSTKDHDFAYAGHYKPAVSRAVWLLQGQWVYTDGGRYFDRMVALTGSDEKEFYKGFAKEKAIAPITQLTSTDFVRAISNGFYGSTFTSGKTTIGTTQLPEGFDRSKNKYHYVIDKMGAVGTLMMNDIFVDIMDSQDYFDEYNAEHETDLKAATKGYFVINPVSTATGKFRIIVSNMALITSEIRDYEAVEITNVTFKDAEGEALESIKDAVAVNGLITIQNRFATEKSVKLVAVAYSGNKMIDIAILPLGMLPANKPSEVNYSFTNLEGLTHIKVLAWESFANMYPYCKAFTK